MCIRTSVGMVDKRKTPLSWQSFSPQPTHYIDQASSAPCYSQFWKVLILYALNSAYDVTYFTTIVWHIHPLQNIMQWMQTWITHIIKSVFFFFISCNTFLRKMLCLTLCLTFLHNMNLRYSNSDVPCKMMPTNWVFIRTNTEDFLLSSSQEPLQSVKTLAQTNVHAPASYKFQTHTEIMCYHF